MTTDTLPCISRDLQLAIRAYGLSNGWKNCARALAYGPVAETVSLPVNTYTPPRKRRNGRKKVQWVSWWEDGRLRLVDYHATKDDPYLIYANERAHELDRTRFSREIPHPFTPARPTTAYQVDNTDIRRALYEPRECCGSPMGIMESWEPMGVGQMQDSDNGYQDTIVKAIYQCAVDHRHQQPAQAN